MAVFSAGVFPPNDLWDFATRLYARGRAKDACLSLQDRNGLDVNVVLFCCWVASSGRGTFRSGELEAALEAVNRWRGHVIQVLRDLRHELKDGVPPAPKPLSDDLRRVVVECELHAEHVEVLMLHKSMARSGTGTFDPVQQLEDNVANLLRYLTLVGVKPEADVLADLSAVLAAGFPDESMQRIETTAAGMAFRLGAGDAGVLGG
ncbi:MAG: TIGR02444 family protein [Minwuia sp.]|uniref:TIGR02444 family protein n=1 Tax=Minwuia sp. TaxID=2493630 RepID=UPI003A8A9F6E